MKTETLTIMEQLSEAMNGASATGRTMYVFRHDERWWYSGKLPHDVSEFYIAYPSGDTDRSICTAEITPEDWNSFWQARGGKKPLALRKNRRVKKVKKGSWNLMSHFKQYFMGYCAFAPHIAFCLCVILAALGGINHAEMWALAMPVCMVCVPLTLLWIISALHRARSETVGILGATLAVEAHFAFYVHLALIATRSTEDSGLFLFTIVGSLAFSGVALLLLWDCQPKLAAKSA
jgi:hypothetical protein